MLLLFGGLEQWQDLYVKKMSPVYGSQGFCPELAKKKAYNEFWRMVAEENWLEIPADEAILVDLDNLEVKTGCCCCSCACVAPELRGKLLL